MNKPYYEGLLIRIKGGQYTLEEIDNVIDKAAGAGLLDEEDTIQYLKKVARIYNDSTCITSLNEPILKATSPSINTENILEFFDLLITLSDTILSSNFPLNPKTIQALESYVNVLYVKMVIAGQRTFESIPIVKKQEVANQLIACGYEPYVSDIIYHTPDFITDQIILGAYTFFDVPKEKRKAVEALLIKKGHLVLALDIEQPSLHYKGDKTLIFHQNAEIILPKIIATDNRDENFEVMPIIKNSNNITIDFIDSSYPGVYSVIYDTEDSSNNGARAIILEVIVEA